ncbi:LysR family transcriptional regulator [Sporomusa acidovorans]|uniref:HTH-type transcriptional regulator GltR n=1 Tax=Sporomusa acidovorans (strain ATCC 49682 / DSM 3132 / Mol) TaxID=1123286 RepID=A0ABZ3J6C9_SPOA4|nr:LysR family transcriptional regulator [Sporomusa acidovorans]OZC15365.1 HTH-type transcriptional regulator GltR [Sporomusa acidovorans DSM 3132]SDF14181.1 DNA-binding transcriptional regulator, LysR family [Sporomusa acidovorans]
MDIQLFQTFLQVAKLNNITQAAEQLNFTQPAVTAQIRALEDHYGVALFERIGKKLYITEAGRELTVQAEKLVGIYQNIDTAMQRFAAISDSVKVGAATTAASYILSPVLLEFQNRGIPGSVTVDICSNLPVTLKGLMDNTYDIAVVHNKIANNHIIQFDLFQERLVWVASRELVAAHNHCTDISRYPFINFRPGSVYRTKFEEVLKDKEAIHSIIEYSDAEAIKRAVLDGMGASILPYVLVEECLTEGALIEFTKAPQITFVMSVAFHKSKELTPAMRSLLTIFAEYAQEESGLRDYLKVI